MTRVGVEKHRLFPGGVESSALVERDESGRLVRVVVVDYQLRGGDTLQAAAQRYRVLQGDDVVVGG